MNHLKISKILLILTVAFSSNFLLGKEPLHLSVVIPSYNNEKWCHKNLLSILKQHYPHWDAIYINDCSTDKTGAIVDNFIETHNLQDKFSVIHNKKRLGSLHNLYLTISKINPHNVVIVVDGDDWLFESDAFDCIVKTYEKDCNVWLTYGNFIIFPSNNESHCRKFPESIIKNLSFRTHPFLSSHLKTFYAGLFHLINKNDLQDNNGKFFRSAGDVAFMLPMLEMASLNHFCFISKILYVYNQNNPLNDHLNPAFQKLCDETIRAKSKYKPLTYAPWKESIITELLNRNREKR